MSIPAAGWRRSNWQPYIRVDSSSGSALYIGSENGAQVVFDSTWGLRVLADTIIFGQNSNDQKSLIFHNGQIKNLSLPGSPNDAANKQYVDEHAGAKVILGSYVGTGKSGKSNPNQITLAAPFKILCIYGMQWQIRIEVSTILVLAKLLSLFPAALSLLSIQAALVFSTLATQEILTVKNQRMEKLSVGIITILHLMQQLCSLIYLKLYITTTP